MNHRQTKIIAIEILKKSLSLLDFRIENIITKGKSDYQTATDIEIEKFIKRELADIFPEIGFIGEELQDNAHNNYNWILDPIDGTTNFICGRAEIAISLALLKDKNPIIGIILLPKRKLIVSTSINESRVSIERIGKGEYKKSKHSIKLLGLPGDFKSNTIQKLDTLINELKNSYDGIRITGALAYDIGLIVLNELESRISFNVKAVDIMAGLLILEKDGAIISDFDGNKYQYGGKRIVISRKKETHKHLLKALK